MDKVSEPMGYQSQENTNSTNTEWSSKFKVLAKARFPASRLKTQALMRADSYSFLIGRYL